MMMWMVYDETQFIKIYSLGRVVMLCPFLFVSVMTKRGLVSGYDDYAHFNT